MRPLDKAWRNRLQPELNKNYYQDLMKFIRNEKVKEKIIWPKETQVFRALDLCPPKNIKAVIIGQDPYPNPVANGLAFSSNPPEASLKNIFRCLNADLGINNIIGNLEPWAKQGVLLLNTILTVEDGKPLSHKNRGWERFIKSLIITIDTTCRPVAWCLWGNHAKLLKSLIKNPKSVIIESVHPSPLSAYKGFFFHKPFSKINKFCKKQGYDEIDWKT